MTDDRVLISTHDLPRAGRLRDAFKEEGYGTELVTPAEEIGHLQDAVLLVLTGGLADGGGALARQARDEMGIPVFAIADEDGLLPALRPGFAEVFPRSASEEEIVLLGRRLIELERLQRITGIVGQTDAIRQALERVVQIAPVQSTVLITGESGTGKELVARGIHLLSPRRHKPFIAVNVAALSETLLESELFGHEKGAFTGAIDTRKGMFELAHGGTIFLDEIGEMPLTTQTKLLRVLEQREFHRVGGQKTIQVDVRIIAATNQDLRQLVSVGEFRRDLYFRLNVLHIELPALRERRDDIPLLVRAFIREASREHDRSFPGLSPEAMKILTEYSWPGNVRELRNLVESMVVLAPGRMIQPEDIPEAIRAGRGSALLPAPIPRAGQGDGETRDLRPELEFIFRTLVDLRVDVDELKTEFARYRQEQGALGRLGIEIPQVGPGVAVSSPVEGTAVPRPGGTRPVLDAEEIFSARDVHPVEEPVTTVSDAAAAEPPAAGREPGPEGAAPGDGSGDGVVVFRPGTTMEEMERQAIAAALREVRGNRRKAAELLGIGERTLYRKIAKYGLEG